MSYRSKQTIPNPSAASIVEKKAASRLAAGDATLFDFSESTVEFASHFMGWTTLSSNPPYPVADIAAFAREQRSAGLTDVLVLGQGGSTQAAMTMSELLAHEGRLDIGFYTMDSMSSEYLDWVWSRIVPETTVFIVSSKSGSTLEPMTVFKCLWERLCRALGAEKAGSRFVAITDPGSQLEALAGELGFCKVFHGEPTVGGRFSALSVFGLVPFALMGLDVEKLVEQTAEAERACSVDEIDNPAVKAASYMKEFHIRGRNKICFNFSPACESLGLWLEQLIAESTGKDGRGLLPNTENDIEMLARHNSDRMTVVYTYSSDEGKADGYGCTMSAEQKCELVIAAGNPCIVMSIDSPEDLACHMVVWEFAVSVFSALVDINPFDQPDVEATKKAVKEILGKTGVDSVVNTEDFMVKCTDRAAAECGVVGFDISRPLIARNELPREIDDALGLLFSSMNSGDFFCLNAFMPYHDEARMAELEKIRREVSRISGCTACLEIGPRYLHSIGQFQKGGYNKGVFLIISSAEENEVDIPGEGYTLTYLGITQARGDYVALNAANRRALDVFMGNNSPASLAALADRVRRHVPSQLS